MRLLIFCALFICSLSLNAQVRKTKFDLFIGAQYGGPLPSKTIDSASGTPLLSPQIGGRTFLEMSKISSISLGIAFSQKGANYSQKYKRDTLVDVGFGLVPTFYTANVVGQIKLLYLDVPIDYCYKISEKQTIAFGINSSFLLSGFDKGTVSINGGYGGYGGFADLNQEFDNFSTIQKFDFGGHFFYKYLFYKNFFTSIDVYRSFRGLYKSSDNNLFHTHATLAFGYSF